MAPFRPLIRSLLLVASSAIIIASATGSSCGEVVVLSNRTSTPVDFEVRTDAVTRRVTLPPEDCVPLFAASGVHIREMVGGRLAAERTLAPNRAYEFASRADGTTVLQDLRLGERLSQSWQADAIPPIELPESNVIKVKVVVDDDEVRHRQAWEPVIRERIDKVSAALEAHCGMKLRIVAFEEWDSDDNQRDFFQTLAEFEREVLPAPADVAIAFSSQYDIAAGRVHLGGTRQPLHSHILVKERSRSVLEPERTELLAHELGHYLGASHSADPKSVMRPVIGQGVQRVAGAKLRYDAPSALLMSLVAEEMRRRNVKSISDLSPQTRRRMQEVYAALDPKLPDDPAAAQYVRLMGAAGAQPLIEDTSKILAQIVRVANLKKKLVQQAKDEPPPTGDELFELYVQQAAYAAKQVRRENAVRAFVLALGIALDESDTLRRLPIAGAAIETIEPEGRRQERHAAFADMPTPSVHGNAELAKHFVVASHLVALLGSEPTRDAAQARELLSANGGAGFRFAELTANRAGVAFAVAVMNDRLSLDDVARRFKVEAFVPAIDGLQKTLQAEEFVAADGGNQRLQLELRRIEASLSTLPIYQQSASESAN